MHSAFGLSSQRTNGSLTRTHPLRGRGSPPDLLIRVSPELPSQTILERTMPGPGSSIVEIRCDVCELKVSVAGSCSRSRRELSFTNGIANFSTYTRIQIKIHNARNRKQ